LLRAGLGVVGLHGEEDEIVGRKIGGALGRLDPEFQIALDAFDLESLLLECAELLAARAEDDVLTGRLQARAVNMHRRPRLPSRGSSFAGPSSVFATTIARAVSPIRYAMRRVRRIR
jgi:hypothetical protein